MTVQELALKTIAEIERRGWMRGNFHPESINGLGYDDAMAALATCKVCIAGGARAAAFGRPDRVGPFGGEYDELLDELAVAADPTWREEGRHSSGRSVVYDWNDEPGRTKGEVLALLHRVAQQ